CSTASQPGKVGDAITCTFDSYKYKSTRKNTIAIFQKNIKVLQSPGLTVARGTYTFGDTTTLTAGEIEIKFLNSKNKSESATIKIVLAAADPGPDPGPDPGTQDPVNINLSKWKLQLPVGPSNDKVLEITQLSTYSSQFFYLNTAKTAYIVNAPVWPPAQPENNLVPAHTPNSKTTRSELRELSSWNFDVGKHTLITKLAVRNTPLSGDTTPSFAGEVVLAQLFCGSNTVINLRYFAKSNEIVIVIEDNGNKSPRRLSSYTLGDIFEVKLEIINKLAYVYYNDAQIISDALVRTSYAKNSCYFKTGVYNQVIPVTTKPDVNNINSQYAEAALHKVIILHQ
ncbi:hypothetical protein HK099_000370, partial [Clydaea vesicula]